MNQKIILCDNQSYDIPLGDFIKIRGWLTRKREVGLVVELTDAPDVQKAGDSEIYLTRLAEKSSIIVRARGNVDFPLEHSAIVSVEQPSGRSVSVELPETRLDGSPEGVVGVLIPSEDGASIKIQALGTSTESNLSRGATTIGSALRMIDQETPKAGKIHVYIDKTASASRAVSAEMLEPLAEMVKGISKFYECELVGDDISDISAVFSGGLSSIGGGPIQVADNSALVVVTDALRPSLANYQCPTLALVIGPNSTEVVRLYHEAYPEEGYLHAVAITPDVVAALQDGNHKALVQEAQIISNGLT